MSFLKSLNAKAIFNFFVALVNLFVLTTIIRSEVWVDVVQFLIHSIAAVVVVFVVYKLFQFASVCWYPNEEQKAQQCICVSQWVALKTKNDAPHQEYTGHLKLTCLCSSSTTFEPTANKWEESFSGWILGQANALSISIFWYILNHSVLGPSTSQQTILEVAGPRDHWCSNKQLYFWQSLLLLLLKWTYILWWLLTIVEIAFCFFKLIWYCAMSVIDGYNWVNQFIPALLWIMNCYTGRNIAGWHVQSQTPW